MPVRPAAASCASCCATMSGSPTNGSPPIPFAWCFLSRSNSSGPCVSCVMFRMARMLSTAAQSALSRMQWRQYASASAAVGRQVMTPNRIDIDVPAVLACQGSHLLYMRCGLVETHRARHLREQRVAVADCKGLPGRRRAGVHDERTRPAIGFGLRPHFLELDEPAVEIENVGRRPGQLDRVDPFLCVFVAALMLAQRRAEHLELALVPAANHVEAEAALAD